MRGVIRRIPAYYPRVLYKNVKWQDEYGSAGWSREKADISEAEVVSSEMAGRPGWHCPVLDLDVRHHLIPSSTDGHAHLYLEVPMTWRRYKRFLKICEFVGILEKGYVKSSIKRRYSAVRVPWLKKLGYENQIVHFRHNLDGFPLCFTMEQRIEPFSATTDENFVTCLSCKGEILEQLV